MRLFPAVLLAAFSLPAWAAHGYALWGELKYPPGFAHFDYVNPAAPKGGEIRLVGNSRASTFDKYNPFTIKGSAPTYLAELLFDSLLAGSLDEAGAAYGLLAEDVSVAPDRLSATFRLRAQARFHNGDPVLARDVQAQLSDPDRPAHFARLQDAAGRGGGGGRAGRAHRALSLSPAQPRTAADGGRPAGVQPQMGRRASPSIRW
jgi:microcin C transport system substrate-binding protein